MKPKLMEILTLSNLAWSRHMLTAPGLLLFRAFRECKDQRARAVCLLHIHPVPKTVHPSGQQMMTKHRPAGSERENPGIEFSMPFTHQTAVSQRKGKVKSLSRVRLFVTPWIVAY